MRVDEIRRPFKDENKLDLGRLHDHMFATHFNLRVATGTVALLFPLVLGAGSTFSDDPCLRVLRRSISAYFHTDMQEVFVGVLLFIGAILLLYRGYSELENLVLNAAGVLAWGVALLPTSVSEEAACGGGWDYAFPVAHGVCALLFFLCIAYVCIWRSRDTLDYVQAPGARRWYRRAYRTLGTLMVVLPLLAAALLFLLEPTRIVFWVEVVAVWVFGIYWLVKSVEVKQGAVRERTAGPSSSAGQ